MTELLDPLKSLIKDIVVISENNSTISQDITIFDVASMGYNGKEYRRGLTPVYPDGVKIYSPDDLGRAPYSVFLISLLSKVYLIEGLKIKTEIIGEERPMDNPIEIGNFYYASPSMFSEPKQEEYEIKTSIDKIWKLAISYVGFKDSINVNSYLRFNQPPGTRNTFTFTVKDVLSPIDMYKAQAQS